MSSLGDEALGSAAVKHGEKEGEEEG